MILPRWIPFAIAFWVIAFGILRLRIATRKEVPEDRPNFRKGGYYGRSKRSHAIYGVAYLLVGLYCVAMGFGYQVDFVRSCQSSNPSSEKAKPSRTQGGVPVKMAPGAPDHSSSDSD